MATLLAPRRRPPRVCLPAHGVAVVSMVVAVARRRRDDSRGRRGVRCVQSQLKASIGAFFESYKGTEKRVKMIDVYLLFTLATAVAQFVYCSLVGTFPFNSFLSGFGCALGAFVLGGSSRALAVSACATLCVV